MAELSRPIDKEFNVEVTEDVPVEDNYELIGDVDIETKTVTNG